MKKNLSECLMIKFEPVENIPADLADFLDGYFTVTACNYKDDGREEYVGYAAMDFDADDLKQQATAIGVKLLPYTVEPKVFIYCNVGSFLNSDTVSFTYCIVEIIKSLFLL